VLDGLEPVGVALGDVVELDLGHLRSLLLVLSGRAASPTRVNAA
jgi:hypothetical protein